MDNETPEVAIDLNASFPGSDIAKALIEAYTVGRSTMSQENRDNWDHLMYMWAKGWNNWWVGTAKWPGEIIK